MGLGKLNLTDRGADASHATEQRYQLTPEDEDREADGHRPRNRLDESPTRPEEDPSAEVLKGRKSLQYKE
jgi:hypothetical protein